MSRSLPAFLQAAVATIAATAAIADAQASADIPTRQPVFLGSAASPARAVHGSIPGRPATGTVVAVTPTDDGSRVTVALDAAVDGSTEVVDEIPASRDAGITRWTDRFDAVRVGDAVTARVLRTGAGPQLTSVTSVPPDDDADADTDTDGADFGPRWSTFGQPFRPWRLPQSWDLQAGIAQTARDGVLAGMGWWQADPLSFWQLDAPGSLSTSPSLHDCERGVPAGSWLRFGEVRANHDGAIGVAMYCSDASGRSAFEIVLDFRVDYDLDVVAAHELGHGIGLGHSNDLAATMWPVAHPKNALGSDDLNGIRAMYPGRIAAYATLPGGFVAVGGDPRVRRALVRVVPVGEPGLACDRDAVRVRVDPPEARPSFQGTAYDPATGLAIPESGAAVGPVCDFHLETRPRSEVDAGPGRVTLTPVYPDTTVQQAAEAEIRLPRAPQITSLSPAPASVRPGEPVALHADVSDLDGDLAGVAWDLNADGAFDDAAGPDVTTSFAAAGTKEVAARATDDTGLTATRSASVSVTPAPVDRPPSGGGPTPGQSPPAASPPASSPAARRLVITSARLTRAGRLRVNASFTRRADLQTVRVTVRVRGRTRTYYQVIRAGRISFDRAIGGGRTGAPRVTVTLTFRGSPAVARTSATIHLR